MPLVRKIRCLVKNIYDHGGQVYTVELAPEREAPLFHPGQFLHLALDEYDPSSFWPDSRAFSIASSPSSRSLLKISYSVKGQFTSRMEKELAVGKWVWAKLPYGEFVINPTEDVVLIAGGTGITAFSAFIEALKPKNAQHIYLFYGARSENLLIFRETLSRIAAAVPNFHLQYALETAPQNDRLEGIPVQVDRLSIDWIWNSLPAPANVIYFLSGPPVMLKRFSDDLRVRQVPDRQIRIDAWE